MPTDSVIEEAQQTREGPDARSDEGSPVLLLRRLTRVLDLQWRILLLQAKMAAWRVTLFIGLICLGAVVGLFALVCLWIAGFQGLMLIMPVALAWVTYGVIHAIAAVVLIVVAQKTLHGGEKS